MAKTTKAKSEKAPKAEASIVFKSAGGADGRAVTEMTPRLAACTVALCKGLIKALDPIAEVLPPGQYLADLRNVNLRGDVHVEASTQVTADDFDAADVLAVLLAKDRGAEGRVANIVRDLKAAHGTKAGAASHAKAVKIAKSWIKSACSLKKATSNKPKAGATRCVPTVEIGEAVGA